LAPTHSPPIQFDCNYLRFITQHLKTEEGNDNTLVGLVHDMRCTLSLVAIVKGRARIEELKLIVKDVMELVKNASHFIVDYFARGRLGMCLAA
jgi:hypothetical protein